MTIRPISPVSFSGNYNKLAFEGKKQNKEKSTLSFNPAKKLAVPLAATVIAMSNPQAVSAKELYSDINENYIAMNDTNTKYVSQNKSSNIGTPLTSKLFYPKNSTGTIRVRPFDTDNDPTTAEKLVLDIPSYDGSYDIGEVKSVGSGTLTVTGAYDSRSSKLIQYDQTEVRFDNYDTNSIFFNKELHDYILNFAQNKTNIKNNGAVKINGKYNDETTTFTVDEETHTIWCEWCGNRVEPFDAVMALTNYSKEVIGDLQRAHEEAVRVFKLARNYRPWRRAMKNIERCIRSGMLPRCPHCEKPFKLEEIEFFTHERLYKEAQK